MEKRPKRAFYIMMTEKPASSILDVTGFSQRLPQFVEGLMGQRCFHTGKGNFFTVEIVDDEGKHLEYEVYFTASRAKNGCLNLFVQSAYVRDNVHVNRPRRKPIGFHVILFNTQNNRPIVEPK
jgi:hypothetical protein